MKPFWPTITATFFLALAELLFLSGCGHAWFDRLPAPAKATASLPSGAKVSQSGNAAKPASYSEGNSLTEIPLPKNSVLTLTLPDAKQAGKIEVKLSADSSIKSKSNSGAVSMPQSFPPPAPPSPGEIAKGQGVKLFYWLSGGLILLTLGLAYTQHFKAAVVAGIGAIGTPIFGNFVSEASALTLAISATVGAGCLFLAWFFLRDKLLPPISPPKTS